MADSGYSGTALLKKLGISENSKILLLHAPKDYFLWLERDVSRQVAKAGERIDLGHLFVTSYNQFEAEMAKLTPLTKANPSIIIWVSWFKKSTGLQTDVTEEAIRNFALANNLIDVKVCAVNEIWSELKLVVPKSKRQS